MNKILQIGVMACVLMSQIDSVHAGLFSSNLKPTFKEVQNIYSKDYTEIVNALKNYKTNVDKIQKIIAQLAAAGKKGNDALIKEFSTKMEKKAPNAAYCVSLMALMNQYNALATYLSKAIARLSTALKSLAKAKKSTDVSVQTKIIAECAERLRAASYIGKFSSVSLTQFVKIGSELANPDIPVIGDDALTAVFAKTGELRTCVENLSDISRELIGHFNEFGDGGHGIVKRCKVMNTSFGSLDKSFDELRKFVDNFDLMVNGEKADYKTTSSGNEEDEADDDDDPGQYDDE